MFHISACFYLITHTELMYWVLPRSLSMSCVPPQKKWEEEHRHRWRWPLSAFNVFYFSSFWIPRVVDEVFRGSHHKTSQHPLVLEGTHTGKVCGLSWHHIFADQNSMVNLENVPQLFLFLPVRPPNGFVPTARMFLTSCQRKSSQVKEHSCAPQAGITVLFSFPQKQQSCIWML